MKRFSKHNKKNFILLILLCTFSIMSYYMLFDSIIDTKVSIINLNNEKAKLSAHIISNYLNKQFKFSKTLEYTYNSMKEKGVSDEKIKDIIRRIINNYSDINCIGIANSKGEIKLHIINYKKNLNHVETNMSSNKYFKESLEGKNTIFITKGNLKGEEAVIIASPYYEYIKGSKNKVINGVFFIEINKQALTKIINEYNKTDEEYVCILDKNYNILIHSNSNELKKNMKDEKFVNYIKKKIVSKNKGYFKIKSKIDNKTKLVSYKEIKGSPWIIIYYKENPYIPVFNQFIINFNILLITGVLIYLILKNYFLQIKREEEFLIYKMERMEILVQISAGVAHEIRNPLSTVKGYLQMNHIKKPTELSTIALKDLYKIEESLNQFLKLSQPLKEKVDKFYPYEIIDEIYTVIEAIGLLKDVNVDYYIDKELSKTNFPKDYLRFIILDLIQLVINSQDKYGNVKIKLKKFDDKNLFFSIESDEGKINRKLFLKQNKNSIFMIKKIVRTYKGKVDITSQKEGKNIINVIIPFDVN